MEEVVGYLLIFTVIAFIVAAVVAATLGIGLAVCALWAVAGVVKGAFLAVGNFVGVLGEARAKVPTIAVVAAPRAKTGAKSGVKPPSRAPQPASKIYAYDRGWRVMKYVREHLFQRTSVAAQDWIKQAGVCGSKARLASSWAMRYWWACRAFGSWLAGAAQYLSAMTVVCLFV
ncbi:MAG: hypothetical protein ACRDHE_02770, partial [Ktedonobacterales bacterium]